MPSPRSPFHELLNPTYPPERVSQRDDSVADVIALEDIPGVGAQETQQAEGAPRHEVVVRDAIEWANSSPPGTDSRRSVRVAYLLASEVMRLQHEEARLLRVNEEVVALNAQLKKDVHHWKNNHETEVRRARILKERPDLPIERVKAYEQWGKDQKQLAALKVLFLDKEQAAVHFKQLAGAKERLDTDELDDTLRFIKRVLEGEAPTEQDKAECLSRILRVREQIREAS